ncbi:MAG: nucleotidyltransferase domain-containing protein [Candidatus Gastranaerophilales bacterium]
MEDLTKIDISKEEYELIINLLKKHLPNTIVWAYGSRVKSTSTKYSDLDLVAFSDKSQNLAIGELKEAFEESNLAFRVDLFVWDNLPGQFKENIKKEYYALQK